jgi:hypothetical protein
MLFSKEIKVQQFDLNLKKCEREKWLCKLFNKKKFAKKNNAILRPIEQLCMERTLVFLYVGLKGDFGG